MAFLMLRCTTNRSYYDIDANGILNVSALRNPLVAKIRLPYNDKGRLSSEEVNMVAEAENTKLKMKQMLLHSSQEWPENYCYSMKNTDDEKLKGKVSENKLPSF